MPFEARRLMMTKKRRIDLACHGAVCHSDRMGRLICVGVCINDGVALDGMLRIIGMLPNTVHMMCRLCFVDMPPKSHPLDLFYSTFNPFFTCSYFPFPKTITNSIQ